MRGVADPLEGQEAVRSTAGPFAHCPEDLDLVMKVYMASEPWRTDPAILRMPWANTVTTSDPERKYCFAIAYGDELVSLGGGESWLTERSPLTRQLCVVSSIL